MLLKFQSTLQMRIVTWMSGHLCMYFFHSTANVKIFTTAEQVKKFSIS